MGKQSRIIAALFACWCVIGTAYWSFTVPLVPDWSIDLRGRTVEFSGDASAPVVLRLWRDNQLKEPLEIIEPADILHSRRALFAGDRPYLLDVKQYNLAIINRAGRLLAIDLKTDRVISDLGSTAGVGSTALAALGKVVLVDRNLLEAFELETGRLLWSLDKSIAYDDFGSKSTRILVSSMVMQDDGLAKQSITSVNAWTGHEHPWLAGIGPYLHAVDSPGEKYVLVSKKLPDQITVHDAQTGRQLWRLPVQRANSTPHFSRDGEELVLPNDFSTGTTTYLHWKTATGEALAPLTFDQVSLLIGRSREKPGYQLKSSSDGILDQLLNKLEKLRQKPVLFRNQPTFVLEESGSKRSLGMITTITTSYPEDYPTKWIGGPAQVLVQTPTQLNYYSKASRRSWVRLVIWCLGPPLLVAVTMYCLDSLRRRFKRIRTTTPGASPDSTVGRLAAQWSESTSSPDPASDPREMR